MTALGLVCALSGQYIACVLNGRVRMLEKICLMLTSAESNISFLKSPAVDLIKNLAENSELRELEFLQVCHKRMESGEAFPTAWKRSVRDAAKYLQSGDIAVLISFGEQFGTTDSDGQISNCRVHSELIENRLENARSTRERYSSLACGMGIICGLGVIIMMI